MSFSINDTVETVDKKQGTITRTRCLGLNNAILVNINGQTRAYLGNNKSKLRIKKTYQNKVAYFFDGPISMWGLNLTNHHNISDRLKTLLTTEHNFSDTKTIRSNPSPSLDEFITKMQQPDTLGVLSYCGHGTQSSSSSESDGTQESWFGIGDTTFTNKINSIHSTSLLILIVDACFSDGIINQDQITNPINYIYYSAARQDGPDDTRSALYTGDGGWLTYNFIDFLEKREKTTHITYNEILNQLTSNPSRYYNDGGNNLHWPKIITSNQNILNDFFLN